MAGLSLLFHFTDREPADCEGSLKSLTMRYVMHFHSRDQLFTSDTLWFNVLEDALRFGIFDKLMTDLSVGKGLSITHERFSQITNQPLATGEASSENGELEHEDGQTGYLGAVSPTNI
jgi:hypothetical protein